MSTSEEARPEVKEAKVKIARFCAYQERYHSEVSEKLFSYGLFRNEVEELIAWLITENYLNEERFAKAFAGGKFRIKKWGRLKITNALEQKNISNYCVRKGLEEIDDEEYEKAVENLILNNAKKYADANVFVQRNKLSKAIIAKGYEPDLVWVKLTTLIPD